MIQRASVFTCSSNSGNGRHCEGYTHYESQVSEGSSQLLWQAAALRRNVMGPDWQLGSHQGERATG